MYIYCLIRIRRYWVIPTAGSRRGRAVFCKQRYRRKWICRKCKQDLRGTKRKEEWKKGAVTYSHCCIRLIIILQTSVVFTLKLQVTLRYATLAAVKSSREGKAHHLQRPKQTLRKQSKSNTTGTKTKLDYRPRGSLKCRFRGRPWWNIKNKNVNVAK